MEPILRELPEEITPTQLDLWAYDIADLLAKDDCPIDIAQSDIRAALPQMLVDAYRHSQRATPTGDAPTAGGPAAGGFDFPPPIA
jgi:hypothetical protein